MLQYYLNIIVAIMKSLYLLVVTQYQGTWTIPISTTTILDHFPVIFPFLVLFQDVWSIIIPFDFTKFRRFLNRMCLFGHGTTKSKAISTTTPIISLAWTCWSTMCDFHDFGLTWKCQKIFPCGCTITSKTKINVVWNFFYTPGTLRAPSVRKNFKQRWF